MPNKHIRLLNQELLLQYNLAALKVSNIDEIYVYCSDKRVDNFIGDNIIFCKD